MSGDVAQPVPERMQYCGNSLRRVTDRRELESQLFEARPFSGGDGSYAGDLLGQCNEAANPSDAGPVYFAVINRPGRERHGVVVIVDRSAEPHMGRAFTFKGDIHYGIRGASCESICAVVDRGGYISKKK